MATVAEGVTMSKESAQKDFGKLCRRVGGLRVLLATNNPFVAHYFEQVLDMDNCFLSVECDGRSAEGGLNAADPDVVVLDEHLVDMDTLGLARAVHGWRPNLPVIFIAPEQRREFYNSDAFAVIQKPFCLDSVFMALGKVAEHGKLQAQTA